MAKSLWGIIFSNAGTILEPDNTKQNGGWEAGEKPPHSAFNWFWNKITNNFKVLNEQGCFEWDAATTYNGDSLVIHSDGWLYVSNTNANTNNTPSATSTAWQRLRRPNIYTGATQPVNGQVGNLWFDFTTNKMKCCSVAYPTNTWVDVFVAALWPKAVATGSGSAMTVDFSPDFTDVNEIRFAMVKAPTANTVGNPTLTVDGLAVKTLCRPDGTALSIKEITGWFAILYDSVFDKYVVFVNAPIVATQAQVDDPDGNSILATWALYVNPKTLAVRLIDYALTAGSDIPANISGKIASVKAIWDHMNAGTAHTYSQISGVPDVSIGVNQTWQNMTGSRTRAVTYTNLTGRPIFITVESEVGGNKSMYMSLNGVIVASNYNQFGDRNFKCNFQLLIPNGNTYRYDYNNNPSSGVTKWYELR
jgi:hypothetical protein